jgi:hypothetical protein
VLLAFQAYVLIPEIHGENLIYQQIKQIFLHKRILNHDLRVI